MSDPNKGHINSLAATNMTIKATEALPKEKVLYFFIKPFYTLIAFSGTVKRFFAIMYSIFVTLVKGLT